MVQSSWEVKSLLIKARKYRKWYGGGLHQSGYMAAAALFAIQNNVTRLVNDHKHAKELANSLKQSNLFKLIRNLLKPIL